MLLTPGNQTRKGEIFEQSLPFGELYTPERNGRVSWRHEWTYRK